MSMSINSGEFPNLLQNDKLLVRMPKMASVKRELQVALRYLTDHSLTHSAKWYHHAYLGSDSCCWERPRRRTSTRASSPRASSTATPITKGSTK